MIVLALPILLFACKSTKLVKEGEHLLVKNKIEYQDTKDKFNGVEDQVRHEPNRRVLGIFRFHLGVFNFASHKTDTSKNRTNKKRNYLRENVGEAPVILDSNLVANARDNIRDFLISKGYFDAQIETDITLKKKKAKVTYKVTVNEEYRYDSIEYYVPDDSILNIFKNAYNTKISKGAIVDFDVLNVERTQLTSFLKNQGYYFFKKDYVSYELDTSQKENDTDIEISIVNRPIESPHLRCKVNSLTFVMNQNDSFSYNLDTSIYNDVKFIRNGYRINESILYKFCFIKLNGYYSPDLETQTYSGLASLNLFDFIDIRNIPRGEDSSKLDVIISLSTGKPSVFSIEPQAITTDDADFIESDQNQRNFGIANTITYSLKNAFRNAEQLDFSATTSLQAQGRDTSRFFNSFNQSVSATLFLPQSQILQNVSKKYGYGNVKTSISASYIYENNIDFTRKILTAKYGYQLSKNNHSIFLTPFEISYSRSNVRSIAFDTISDPELKDFYTRLFAPNLITNSSLGYIYTNKAKGGSYWYLRSKVIEIGGLTHRLTRSVLDNENASDTSYSLLGVHYYQYLKSDIDIRFNHFIDKNNSFVYRINIGLGVPYGNSNVLPYEKRFFVGGANSLRGWRPRTVGPGTVNDSKRNITQLDRTGEFMILLNGEYRFQFIKKYLELAIFADMGNVWNITPTDQNVKGYFNPRSMFSDMALNTGLGFRFDFQFFMLRLDWGIRLKDPTLKDSEKWVINNPIDWDWVNENSVLNLGIGYPF